MERLEYHVVCFSGGHSSALTAIEVARQVGTEHFILLNNDINPSTELPDIKRFKSELASYLKVPITFANAPDFAEMDHFDIAMKKGALTARTGPQGTAVCTYHFKTKPFMDYLKETFPEQNCIVYYGFQNSERKRALRRAQIMGSQGWRTAFPLQDWPRTIKSVEEVGIQPPLSYGVFEHANCLGCVKGGAQHWYVIYCMYPSIWAKAKLMEEEIEYNILSKASLAEIEPLYEKMKCVGIEPSEKEESETFWSAVRRAMNITDRPSFDVLLEASKNLPCECST